MPPFGTFVGDSLIASAARPLGLGWLKWVIIAAAVLTGAAVLRLVSRVFWGWGYFEKEAVKGAKLEEQQETERGHYRTPIGMIAPTAILILGGAVMGLVRPLLRAVESSAMVFQNRDAYIATVLNGTPSTVLSAPASVPHVFGHVFEGLFAVTFAVLLVVITLFRDRIFRRPIHGRRLVQSSMKRLQQFHSGHVGDFVTWLVIGVSVYGGLLMLLIIR